VSFGSGERWVGVNEAARTYNVPKTTLKRYNTGKAITSLVPIGHPMDLPNVVEDVLDGICYIWRTCFMGMNLSFGYKLKIRL
jgi:hypothetical protein